MTKSMKPFSFFLWSLLFGSLALLSAPVNAATAVNELRPHDIWTLPSPYATIQSTGQTTPWGVDNTNGINALQAHTEGYTGAGVVVAVVDTGVNYNHEDLSANIWSPANGDCIIRGEFVSGGCPNGGYDFVNDDNMPLDDDNHGTAVAGIIAAEDNSVGVIGVAPDAQLMVIRALTYTSGSLNTIAKSVQFAIENGADVINMSLGSDYTGFTLATLQDVIAEAEAAGIPVIASSGNSSTNASQFPSRFESVIAVGAIQEIATGLNPYQNFETRLGYFSNFGKVDVVAPGMGIITTTDTGGYSDGDLVGTSLAAPYVTGAVALLKQKDPTLTPQEVRNLLQTTATDFGRTGKDDFYGSGLVNVDAALDSIGDASTKIVLIEGNWSQNSSIEYSPGYYLEPLTYTVMLPANGYTTSRLRVRVATADGTPVVGETVRLELSAGAVLDSTTAVTHASGIAYFTILVDDTVGQATATATLSSTGATDALVLTYADTLLVNDTGQPDRTVYDGWHLSQALEANDVHWRMSAHPYPAWETALNDYDRVIWATGSYSLSTPEQQIIKTYLDHGGNILVTGGDILHTYNYYATDSAASDPYNLLNTNLILSSYFHVSYAKPVASSQIFVGDGVFDATGGYLGDYGNAEDNYPYSDVIAVKKGGTVAGYFCSNTEPGLVITDSTYRSAFFSAALNNFERATAAELLGSLLAFLSGEKLPTGSATLSSSCDSSTTENDGTASDPSSIPVEVSAPLSSETNADLVQPSLKHPVLTVDATTVTLSWDDNSALHSSIAYAIDRNGALITQNTGTNSTVTLSGLTAGETYELAVYGIYPSGYTSPLLTETVTITAVPAQPTVHKKSRYTLTAAFADIENNQFITGQLLSPTHDVLSTASSAADKATLTFRGLASDTNYQLRGQVVTTNSDGSLTRTPLSTLVTGKTFPDRVKKISLLKKKQTSVHLQWKRPTRKGVKKYVLQLDKKNNRAYKKIATINIKKTKKETVKQWVQNLEKGKSYRVRLKIHFTNGEKGPFTKYYSFKTKSQETD